MNKDSEKTDELNKLVVKEVEIKIEQSGSSIENLTDKVNIVKDETKVELTAEENFDRNKYLKSIKEKELLNLSISPIISQKIESRIGTRTNKNIIHSELPPVTRKPKNTMAEKMTLDRATSLIPICSGSKDVASFINACDIAWESVDKESAQILIKVINSKLTGNALEACKYRETNTWESIKSILKGAFEHQASARSLTVGLQFARMKDNENVQSYASRVEELYYNLCTAGTEKLDKEEAKLYKKQLKNQALIIFINGLKDHLKIIVKARDPKSLEMAMQIAKDEEMEYNASLEMDLFKKHLDNKDANKNGSNNTQGYNTNRQNFNNNRGNGRGIG